jgi:hypothetical protein
MVFSMSVRLQEASNIRQLSAAVLTHIWETPKNCAELCLRHSCFLKQHYVISPYRVGNHLFCLLRDMTEPVSQQSSRVLMLQAGQCVAAAVMVWDGGTCCDST